MNRPKIGFTSRALQNGDAVTTILNRISGFTYDFYLINGTNVTGRIIEADEKVVRIEVELPLDEISSMDFV